MNVKALEAKVARCRAALANPEGAGLRPEQISGMELILEMALERLAEARERRATPKGRRRPL